MWRINLLYQNSVPAVNQRKKIVPEKLIEKSTVTQKKAKTLQSNKPSAATTSALLPGPEYQHNNDDRDVLMPIDLDNSALSATAKSSIKKKKE
ncbi:unnamed protein product [Didymodactylos carnosus]|uniref:Uncharacterized protein n=1 Tax=Didymodactylos carnosus TaxID=1234261 RepID=A0A814TRR0_9BILA|nr:unnamed protein product [Didymodactylos carnosus]CAF1270539.1 unnamed protein product [Didymodactylos carnosus]CAF3928614.1 unnamed protein product [Didymodactylos carnosus]CAF4076135.1 unnamed protein product [Didymodactylos carnosus]